MGLYNEVKIDASVKTASIQNRRCIYWLLAEALSCKADRLLIELDTYDKFLMRIIM